MIIICVRVAFRVSGVAHVWFPALFVTIRVREVIQYIRVREACS
jgi:hypothetical protein